MVGLLGLILFLATAFCIAQILAKTNAEFIFISYITFTLEIFSVSHFLSFFQFLADPFYWLALACVFFLTAFFFRRSKKDLFPLHRPVVYPSSIFFLAPLAVLIFLTLYVGLTHAPGNWDGLAYQLPRALYFIQFGTLAAFPSSYWAQRLHPNLAPIWLITAFILGGMREFYYSLPQFFAWLVLAVANMEIAKKILRIFPEPRNAIPHFRSYLAFTLSLLALIAMLEANTEKNDLLVAVYTSISIYFLISEHRYAYFFAFTSIAFALAVKTSAIPVVPIFAVLLLPKFSRHFSVKRNVASYFFGIALAAAILILGGYGANLKRYHHFLGPPSIVNRHGFFSAPEMFPELPNNLARYAIDATTPDGWPGINFIDSASKDWRRLSTSLYEKITHQDLTKGRIYSTFKMDRPGFAHEDESFWGLSHILIFFAAIAALLIFQRGNSKIIWVWFFGGVFIYFFHSLTPYDAWHGRFFLVAGAFVIPLQVRGLEILWQQKYTRALSLFLILLLFSQSFYALFHRTNLAFFDARTRFEQLFRDQPALLPIFEKIEATVPADAILATKIKDDLPEYVLFGQDYGRMILPTHDFELGDLPIPGIAGWLFFDDIHFTPRSDDMALGEHFYLRKLKK